MMRKEMRRLNKPATKPIIGGPIKKPKNPMLDTAANAIPGEMVVDLPAWLYTSGTTEEMPKPTIKNPVIAVGTYGNMMATDRPVAISRPLI